MKIDDILRKVLAIPNSGFFYTPSIYDRSRSYFFKQLHKEIIINNIFEFNDGAKKINKLIKKGYTGYSLIKYEAGFLFEDKLKKLIDRKDKELIRFYFFDEDNFEIINSNKIKFGKFNQNYRISSFKLNNTRNEFSKNIKKTKDYIKEGDTYQVNYTVKSSFNFSGDVINLFKNLVFNQSAKYSAFINNDENIIISISPELFFQTKDNKIISRPMKGTSKRGVNIFSDNIQKINLGSDEKNKSENLMIVDLLRNDIGKICEYGKVKAKNLFELETYETLFQIVSTIEGRLKKQITLSEIIKNLFPCGSITGAPKIRTMEIIKELEKEKRGIYTGAVGIIKKTETVFNVAIRTIAINKTEGKGELGLGSGIVWDSNPEEEYNEILLKGNFLQKPIPYFELFETMLLENGEIFLLNEHLDRLKNSAQYFLFRYDEVEILSSLDKVLKKPEGLKKYRLKLSLNKWGKPKLNLFDYPENPEEIKLFISQIKVSSENLFQYFKTTNRNFYDQQYRLYNSKGFFDVLFLNEKNELTEGSISNIFIRKDNVWLTSPSSCGLLPGVYRNFFLKNKDNVEEKLIYFDDLLKADEVILTNSLRKEIKVDKIFFSDSEFIEFPNS
jgi:para-aminobenzoate synthetase / 4-amino-4-deoxychorismate lyase